MTQADAGIQAAIESLARALADHGVPHMIIGGIAVIARGVVRTTDDVDATVWGPDTDVDALLSALQDHEIEPRIDDALNFARQSQVLLLRHRPSGVPIEVSIAWLPFEEQALARADELRVGDAVVPTATAEDLVVYKAVAWRDRDRADIERLLVLHGDRVDLERVLERVAEFAEVLERPELVSEFEAVVRRSQSD